MIRRAQELLREHDGQAGAKGARVSDKAARAAVLAALLQLDVNQLSPVEALTKLYELQRLAGQAK